MRDQPNKIEGKENMSYENKIAHPMMPLIIIFINKDHNLKSK